MSLITVLVVLICVGVVLYLINTMIPMDRKIKNILNIVVVVLVVIWLLRAFGVFDTLGSVRIYPDEACPTSGNHYRND
jgi:hypothetical protein